MKESADDANFRGIKILQSPNAKTLEGNPLTHNLSLTSKPLV
jgi:hypothetical protein